MQERNVMAIYDRVQTLFCKEMHQRSALVYSCLFMLWFEEQESLGHNLARIKSKQRVKVATTDTDPFFKIWVYPSHTQGRKQGIGFQSKGGITGGALVKGSSTFFLPSNCCDPTTEALRTNWDPNPPVEEHPFQAVVFNLFILWPTDSTLKWSWHTMSFFYHW